MGLSGVTLLVGLFLGSPAAEAASLRHRTIQNNEDTITQDYNLRLDNFNNVQYSAPLTIGGQTLPVIYDTGSFEILVLSKKCTHCEARHNMFDEAKSTTFVKPTSSIITEHLFGSGPVVSEKGFDTVHLGPLSSPLAIAHMPFWQVLKHEIAVWDENAHFSGIVGLGHPTHIPKGFAAEGERDVLMLAAMQVKSFGICLQRSSSSAPGWLIFGPSVDNMPSNSAFQHIDVVGQTHWGVKMFDFNVPGISSSNPCVPSCGAIIDSGTSLIAAPPAAMPVIKHLSGMVKKDCTNLHQMPTLKFRLGAVMVELPPKAYIMKIKKKVVVQKKNIWNNIFQPSDEIVEHCVPAFMTISKNSAHGPVWILGMPFLRYYYTVFDRMNKKVHVAEATPSCQPKPLVAGPGLFFNVTHGVNGTGTSGMTRFASDDFEPNEVDANEFRMPAWATEGDENSLPF